MKPIHLLTYLAAWLLTISAVAQSTPATPPPPLAPGTARVSFLLKNTLGYHRLFRAYGPGVAYGFTMNRRETTPKNWPVGTGLYLSTDGETNGPLILTVTAADEGKTLTTVSHQPAESRPAPPPRDNDPINRTVRRAVTVGSFRGNALSSATTIPPNKTFELGGSGHGAFTARVKNVGSSAVAVSQRQADGRQTELGQLKPSEKKTLRFAAGATAVFVNPASVSAELALEVTGDTSLKMGYAND